MLKNILYYKGSEKGMLIVQLTINLYGNNLSARDSINIIKDPINISFFHEPTDINPSTNQKYGFGHVAIQHPTQLGFGYQLELYYQWHVNFIENYYKFFKINGLEEINIFIDIYYSNKCSIEIFDNKLLRHLTEYEVSLPLNAYKVSPDKIKEILKEKGYTSDMIEQLFQYE